KILTWQLSLCHMTKFAPSFRIVLTTVSKASSSSQRGSEAKKVSPSSVAWCKLLAVMACELLVLPQQVYSTPTRASVSTHPSHRPCHVSVRFACFHSLLRSVPCCLPLHSSGGLVSPR